MKFEVPIHELGAGDISACENLGVTLSRLFGLSSDICWLAVNHVLGAISASGCTFRSTLLPGRFHAGGLILVDLVERGRLRTAHTIDHFVGLADVSRIGDGKLGHLVRRIP